jgi:hypothetical protein
MMFFTLDAVLNLNLYLNLLSNCLPNTDSDTVSSICVCFSRLGHKIQGVLCDGDSNEVVASTVVNCLKIDEGMMSQCSTEAHYNKS